MYIVIKDGINYIRIKTEKTSFPYVYKTVEIIQNNNDFFIQLKNGSFLDNSRIKKVENKYYFIRQKRIGAEIEIFIYKTDEGIDNFSIYENEPFLIAHNLKANIISEDDLMSKYYLYYRDRKIKTNYDCVLLNGKLYKDEILVIGDEIRFHNFIFYYYDDFLYINEFNTINKIKKKVVIEKKIKYETKKIIHRNYFIKDRKDLLIDEIEEYKPLHQINNKKLIFQIGPSLTMSISMLAIAAINVYNNYLNNQPILNSIVYILMPISMLFSGIVWPLLANFSDKRKFKNDNKKNKQKYVDYLNKYEQDLISKIKEFISLEEKEFFNGEVDENKLFYLTNKSSRFLNISIGHIVLRKTVKTKDCDDEEIQEIVNRIKFRLNNIEGCPYFVDIKSYKVISVVTKKFFKTELLKRYILEISSKYHYDDFYIAIYSEDLNPFADLFSLPQLILNNNRLTINKKRELQDLNNLKLDKPLVIFGYDQIDYTFTNPQIHLIQFCIDINCICKNSELLIEYVDDKNGNIYEKDTIPFCYKNLNIDIKAICKELSPYQKVNFMKKGLTFKDIYKDINIMNFYQEKQNGLRADFAVIGKEVLSFDLHEKKEGPHGLIGGSTGSGKSELIVSMLLSMCLRYRPDYLNIALIDYKGGGIKESLSYMGVKIPHIIASIDNLEADVLDRMIIALDFECKRRQRLFKALSNKSMTSIMSIDDYLSNDYAKFDLPPISHLLIVVDEFAEIKKNNPNIIKELISFSRIGRSLGLHLILATQRPNGTIDDEIWSNSHFKIALKLFSDKDSNDIIKSKEAAYLNNPGEFYLVVDDSLLKATSIYSKKDINNADNYEVMLLDNRLNVIDKKVLKPTAQLSEASYIANKIIEATEKLNIRVDNLSFYKPVSLSRAELKNKYQCNDRIILGEIDDYKNNRSGVISFDGENNVLIFSSRAKEINGIINSLKKRTIVIGSKEYKTRYISDSVEYSSVEDIKYIFKKLKNDNIDVTMIIEDLSSFLAYDDSFSYYLYQLLSRKELSKINVIALCKQSNISFKLLNCFKEKYAIEINETQDLINIFSCHSQYRDKSYFYEDTLIPFVPCKEETLLSATPIYEKYISYIPKKVEFHSINNKVLLGYSINTREQIWIGLEDELLISSYNEEIIEKYKRIYQSIPKIRVEVYSKELSKEDFNRYLWIGEGLYIQRLFYVNGKDDLNENEAYYIKGNRGEKIKPVDE